MPGHKFKNKFTNVKLLRLHIKIHNWLGASINECVYWPVGIHFTNVSILSGVVPPKGLLKTCKWPHNIRMHWNYYFLAYLFSQVCRVILISFHYLTKKAILGHLIDSRSANCLKSCHFCIFSSVLQTHVHPILYYLHPPHAHVHTDETQRANLHVVGEGNHSRKIKLQKQICF